MTTNQPQQPPPQPLQKQQHTFALRIERTITPPSRLVYTHYWLTDETPVETLITIELHEEGDATRVVMLHEGHLTEQTRDGHEEGWSSCFDKLEEMFA
jgi:uncharacterized protein YndB with AHSA1/START domain